MLKMILPLSAATLLLSACAAEEADTTADNLTVANEISIAEDAPATETTPPTPPTLEGSGEQKATGMHPSWDADNDGVNDCEKDGTCDDSVDYSQPRP